jgi:hypothetical protein
MYTVLFASLVSSLRDAYAISLVVPESVNTVGTSRARKYDT